MDMLFRSGFPVNWRFVISNIVFNRDELECPDLHHQSYIEEYITAFHYFGLHPDELTIEQMYKQIDTWITEGCEFSGQEIEQLHFMRSHLKELMEWISRPVD